VAGVLAWIAVVLSVLALVLSYAGRALLRPQPFADRAVAALHDPAVTDDVADHLTNAVVGTGNGDLAAVRPAIRALSGAIVGGKAFAALFRRAVLQAHAAVVERSGGTIFVGVADAGVLIQGALERFSPAAARKIGAERVASLLTLHPGDGLLAAVRIAKRVYRLAWVMALLALLIAAGALWISPDRRRTVRRLGTGLLLGGLLVASLYLVGLAIAGHVVPSGRGPAVRALWRSFLQGLWVQALWFAAAGAVLAAAAYASGTEGWIERSSRQGWRLLTGGAGGSRPGLLGSIGLVLAGVAILLEPGLALTLAAVAVGLYVLCRGVAGVLVAAAHARARLAKGRHGRRARGLRLGPLARGLRLAPIAVGVAALAAAAAVIATGGGDEAPAATPTTCNGFAVLCHRTLNEVALAATHNSMASVTIPSWLFGQQDGTIKDQLDGGIRGLLIDTYYGEPVPGGRIRTDLSSLPKREVAVRELGAPAVDAAIRIRSRLGSSSTGSRGIYLCHGFCELGAVSLASALGDLRSFLVSNPGEVVTVINQDEGVKPADIERAFEQAGLLDLVYRGPLGPFPTLRAMVDSNQRLLVMAENDAGSIPWYHLAYQRALQETPFRFKNAAQLTEQSQLAASCRPNRGPASAPLFLINNWVDTTPVPRASLAATVNARRELLARAEMCQRIRHRLPNLIAVDFYRRGDVLGVVNALNGTSQ
jgi:hypothetical protein